MKSTLRVLFRLGASARLRSKHSPGLEWIMPPGMAGKWVALMLGAAVLSTGCVTVTPPTRRGALLKRQPPDEPELTSQKRGDSQDAATDTNAPARLPRRQGVRVKGTALAMVSPAEMTVRAVTNSARRTDAFEDLLLLAGLDNVHDEPSRGAPLTPQEAIRLLAVLLNKPVTLGSLPPRMAVCHLLREVLSEGEVSHEELLRRVERFKTVAVLRPDGYLAWTLNGRTQQRVGPVEWKEDAFRAGAFELGRFYTASGWVFRQTDAQLRPIRDGSALAEVYDDADYIDRSLQGAEEAFVELYHAMSQLITRPLDSLAALQHLPTGVAALIASSPEYLERFQYMTRGEQVKTASRLLTQLLVTFGTAGGTTSMLTRTVGGLEVTVPVLSLSAEGLLGVERVGVPVGRTATVLNGGPGAAIILHQVGAEGGEGGGAERPSGTSWKPGPNDLDWRGKGKGALEALDEAFKRTGIPREEFSVTKWGRDKSGKSAPVEWRAPNGAEVNIDMGHLKNGPSVPHVGFQTPGKRGSGGAVRGHILLDDVPYNR